MSVFFIVNGEAKSCHSLINAESKFKKLKDGYDEVAVVYNNLVYRSNYNTPDVMTSDHVNGISRK